jgi:hypothetical protein
MHSDSDTETFGIYVLYPSGLNLFTFPSLLPGYTRTLLLSSSTLLDLYYKACRRPSIPQTGS